jgi:hypothetical protein
MILNYVGSIRGAAFVIGSMAAGAVSQQAAAVI